MYLVSLLGLIALLIGCADNHVVSEANQNTSSSNYLIKSASGVTLTERDLKASLLGAPLDAKQSILGKGERFMDFAANQYISQQLVDYALKHSLEKDDQYLARINNYKKRILSGLAVEHYIASQEKPDFNDLAHERYVINQNEYVMPEQIHIAHILIKTSEEHSDSEAQAIINEVLLKAKQGIEFEELAKEFSEDTSAKIGGDLLWVKRGQMVKPFEMAAFKLHNPGEISDVVKTQFGYHVVKLIKKKKSRLQTFQEVKPNIVEGLKAEHNKQLQTQMLLEYEISDDTKVNKEAIGDLYVRWKKELNKK